MKKAAKLDHITTMTSTKGSGGSLSYQFTLALQDGTSLEIEAEYEPFRHLIDCMSEVERRSLLRDPVEGPRPGEKQTFRFEGVSGFQKTTGTLEGVHTTFVGLVTVEGATRWFAFPTHALQSFADMLLEPGQDGELSSH